jgi:hypothetical protein
MKNLLPILLVLFVFASCKDRFDRISVAKSAARLESSGVGPDPIPLELARKMINNYGNLNGASKTSNRILSSTDINPIWLELDNLASLIFNLKNQKADGIRIYFAQFGNNAADEKIYQAGLEENCSYQNTIIITSTKDSLANEPGNTEEHYHKDYFDTGMPLAFIAPSSAISRLKPVPFKLAEYMIKNYGADKRPVINALGQQVPNATNSRVVWFDLDKLESFVTKLQHEKADGVNIYFATYGDNVTDEKIYKAGLEKDHSYRNTIVLVGAKKSQAIDSKGVKTNYHLDALANNESNGEPVTFFTDPVNNGKLCPPDPCKGTAF